VSLFQAAHSTAWRGTLSAMGETDRRARAALGLTSAARGTGRAALVVRSASFGSEERLPRNGERLPRNGERRPRCEKRRRGSRGHLLPCIVGGIGSSERRSAKDERVCRRVPRGALGSSRRARRDERLPLQWQRTGRRGLEGSGNSRRRSRSRSCATRHEEMCHGHEESGFDRSERGSRRSLGGAPHTAGGSGKTAGGARRVARLSRRTTGGARDAERGSLRPSVGALFSSVREGRASRLARRDLARSGKSVERPLLREAGALHTAS
jgi:hypothetical protein